MTKDNGSKELTECRNHKALIWKNIRSAKRLGQTGRVNDLMWTFESLLKFKLPRIEKWNAL